MNVIVGRRSDGQGGFVLDKFSLYYPDNSAISGDNWDLLQGYSFRTAALSGRLNRAGLHGLRSGSIPVAEGTEFEASKHGLVIDDESAYEDCAYVETREGETNSDRQRRIDGMVDGMVAAYGSQGILSLSYDPAERQQGLTALESEWILLKRVAAEERAAAEAAECRLVSDAAQGEVEAMEVQQALGPLKDKKDWSPDAEARECQYCSREFTVYWRRHHCRSCGGIFCANCAPKKAIRLCNTCTAKKAQGTGRKVKTSGTSSPSQAEENDGLMGQWAADAPVATPRSRGSKELGAADTVSDRAALLGAGKPALGKGVSAAEAEALRAAERAAAAGAAAASKVADQGEQIHGVAGSANTAAEFAARAERVDQCYSTFGAIKMAWSRGATLVTGESSADHEPEPEPEPEPPQGTVLAKAMYFRVVQRVRLDPCFEPPRPSSGGTGESGRWLEEGASIQVVESKWIGEQVCRMRLLEGGWVTAIDNDEKFLRRDRARTQASGDDDAVMQKLAQLTTQNLQTGLNINAALTKQAEEIEQIDASVTKAAESTDKLNASAAKKLGGLGKASKRGSASTRSV